MNFKRGDIVRVKDYGHGWDGTIGILYNDSNPSRMLILFNRHDNGLLPVSFPVRCYEKVEIESIQIKEKKLIKDEEIKILISDLEEQLNEAKNRLEKLK